MSAVSRSSSSRPCGVLGSVERCPEMRPGLSFATPSPLEGSFDCSFLFLLPDLEAAAILAYSKSIKETGGTPNAS
jgi:hypothetical protein